MCRTTCFIIKQEIKGVKLKPKENEVSVAWNMFSKFFEMKKFILKEMRKHEDLRVLAKDIKPKFREIFQVPTSCVGNAFSKRLKRFRRRTKFETNYPELQKIREDKPEEKFNDNDRLKWIWAPFEQLQA